LNINNAQIDFVTATTAVKRRYDLASREVCEGKGEAREGRFLQYVGDRYESVFTGEAMQRGKASYLIQVTGEDSKESGIVLIDAGMKVTRIDLQITVKLPSDYSARELADCFSYKKWLGGERKINLIESEGMDTVNVGSRSSNRYIRIYVKEGGFLRFEVEYKKELAVRVAQVIKESGEGQIAKILNWEISRLPENGFCQELSRACGRDVLKINVARGDTSEMNTVRWIRSILPTLQRMSNSHTYGFMVTGWLEDIIKGSYENDG